MGHKRARRSAFLSVLIASSLSVQAQHERSDLSVVEEREAAELGLSPGEFVKREDESPENFYHFVTRPDLTVTKWDITTFERDALAPGYWFLAPYASLTQNGTRKPWVGPYIYDQQGELIWCGTQLFDNWNAQDFQTVDLDGQHLLSLLNMHDRSGIFLNPNYGEYDRAFANPKNHALADMHEFHILPGGTALTVISDRTPSTEEEALAIGIHGSCNANWKGFMEVDLTRKETVFEWSAHGHIGLDESLKFFGTYQEMCDKKWDILHMNSVDKFEDGDYLISARHTNAIYKISHRDGSIVWRLGGTKNDFDKDFEFSRQHHARVHSENSTHTTITLMDNAIGTEQNETKTHPYSRGLLLSLRTDTEPMQARVLQEYVHPEKKLVSSRGSVTILPNGNVFIGWTYGSLFSEHSADGELLMKARSSAKVPSYRIYKAPWVGRPSAPPDVVARAARAKGSGVAEMKVFVSWNGDTEVKTWRMLRSNARGDYTEFLIAQPRHGFETMLTYSGYASHIVMEGLDAKNGSLGRSQVIETRRKGLNGAILDQDEAWMQAHEDKTNQRPATNSSISYSSSSAPASSSQTPFHSYSYAPPPSNPTNFVDNDKSSSSVTDAEDDDDDDDHSLWEEVKHSAAPALTSNTAYYCYGTLTAIFIAVGVWSVLRRRRRNREDSRQNANLCGTSSGCMRPFGRLAWWRTSDSKAKYGPVWNEMEVEDSEEGFDDDDLKLDVVDPRPDDEERRPLR